jgi:hypothetical protein
MAVHLTLQKRFHLENREVTITRAMMPVEVSIAPSFSASKRKERRGRVGLSKKQWKCRNTRRHLKPLSADCHFAIIAPWRSL